MITRTLQYTEDTLFDLEKIILPVVEAEVVFGERARSCAGYGICSIGSLSMDAQGQEIKCCRTKAFLMPDESNRILFLFPKKGMCKNIYRKYFSSGQFIIREDFQLSDALTVELGLDRKFLRRGVYAIEEQHDLISVLL